MDPVVLRVLTCPRNHIPYLAHQKGIFLEGFFLMFMGCSSCLDIEASCMHAMVLVIVRLRGFFMSGETRHNCVMASAPNPDFGWVRVQVLRFNSTYVDASSITQFRSNKNLTFDGNETNVICEPCTKDELVCWGQQRVGSPEYTYMYETLFSKLRVKLPFSPFECHVLRSLNVAPTQLHPNSWGFVRCFEILCRSLGMKASVGRFFYFFEAKLGKEVGWLSLNSTPRRGIMTALMGSYKDFKDKFFRVRAAEHFPELFLGPNGARKFPLYWTLDPVPICGADRKLMSSEEQADVDVLERFSPLSCTKLLQLEHNTEGLQEYLGNC